MTGPLVRLKPWPFETDEVVTLAWFRSPLQLGPQAQWRMVAWFRPQQGKSVAMELDWAMFPLLRLGQRYRDGAPILNDFEAPLERLDLSGAASPKLVTAHSALPSSVYLLHNFENLRELCWLWMFPNQKEARIVVPVLVLLQGLFAGGSPLALGLLNQLFLDSFRPEVDGKTLHLNFASSFALPVRLRERDALLTLLARLLGDASFYAAFCSVALGRILDPLGPLRCEIPELHAVWEARVLSRGNVRLVQELMRAEPAEVLAIDKVTYQHPLYPRREVPLPKPKTTRFARTPRGLVVNTQAPAAKVLRMRSEVPAPNAPLVESSRPVIENVGKLEPGEVGPSVQPLKGGSERDVSFAGTGQNASATQASVRPGHADDPSQRPKNSNWSAVENWTGPQQDGLNAFRAMLVELHRLHPEVEIEFRLGLQQVAGRERIISRPYAVVSLVKPSGPLAWLIEFAQRPSRPISTLTVIGGGETWQEFETLLFQVLSKGLNPKYWWDLDSVASIAEMASVKIERMLHSKRGPTKWAGRVFNDLLK